MIFQMEKFDRYVKWYSKWKNLIDLIFQMEKFDKYDKWYYKWKNLINDIPNGKVW